MSKRMLLSLLVLLAVVATVLACSLLFFEVSRQTMQQQAARQPSDAAKQEMLRKTLEGIGSARDLPPVQLPTSPAHK